MAPDQATALQLQMMEEDLEMTCQTNGFEHDWRMQQHYPLVPPRLHPNNPQRQQMRDYSEFVGRWSELADTMDDLASNIAGVLDGLRQLGLDTDAVRVENILTKTAGACLSAAHHIHAEVDQHRANHPTVQLTSAIDVEPDIRTVPKTVQWFNTTQTKQLYGMLADIFQ